MKVEILYTRTLTLKEIIEVDSIGKANRIAEDRIEFQGVIQAPNTHYRL